MRFCKSFCTAVCCQFNVSIYMSLNYLIKVIVMSNIGSRINIFFLNFSNLHSWDLPQMSWKSKLKIDLLGQDRVFQDFWENEKFNCHLWCMKKILGNLLWHIHVHKNTYLIYKISYISYVSVSIEENLIKTLFIHFIARILA